MQDIDIDIPDLEFEKIIAEVKPYITFGPTRFKNEQWDLLLMTLNYNGQEIDLSGIDSISIYGAKRKQWIQLHEKIEDAVIKNIMGLDLPIISKENLIRYKKILSRDVDLIDIAQIS